MYMDELSKYRKQISEIDAQMVKLFEERMGICGDIALYKKENDLPVRDVSREELIINKNKALLDNPGFAEYYEKFFKNILEISRDYQGRLLESGKTD